MSTESEFVSLGSFTERIDSLADEMMAPLLCTTPAYGAPGFAHCAACCYGMGYIATSPDEDAVVEAAKLLKRAAGLLRPCAKAETT